ncbi:MAG: diaminopimelate epimerase [Bacteroidota bacterium]
MSKPSLVVEFIKMQAAGNDFIVIDNRFYYFSASEESHLAQLWCDRHFGIGADGLIVLNASSDTDADITMRHYNPDGHVATLCGNGTRCAALYASHSGMSSGSTVRIRSGAGILTADIGQLTSTEGRVTVKMPTPSGYLESAIPVEGRDVFVAQVWTGTEHAVYERKETVEFARFAPMVRQHEGMGSRGVNVNEIEVLQPGVAKIRTYEKGVEGETLACGTGAVAAAVFLSHMGNRPDKVLLHAKGGDLYVHEQAGRWYLEGPAAVVYRGTFEYNGES